MDKGLVSTDPMQTEQIAPGAQRRGAKRENEVTLVDPDTGKELSNAKKARIEPNDERKIKVLKFILSSYEKFTIAAGYEPSHCNITISCHVTNAVFTTFNILRQKANNLTSAAETKAMKAGGHKITSQGITKTITHQDAEKLMRAAADEQNLKFEKYENTDKDNWYGTAAPYLDFFAGFQLRLKELRLGHNVMPISKENGKTKSVPVYRYGLNGSHHILLEGCTFPPERRSAMAQSLGPMTSLLLHIRTDAKYRKKWTDASKRALAHIPFIDDVLEAVKGKQAAEISTF